MIIRRRPRAYGARADAEGIVEKPTALLARASIHYGVTQYHLFQLSMPIVVIVHNNQDQIAWAAAIWDSVFCSPNDPYNKVEQGSWHALANAINAKFKKDVTRGLTEENMEFLYWKLTSSDLQANPDPIITWTQFARDRLRPVPTMNDRDCFTFWQWVYASLKLINHNLSGMWQNGLIEGFIHKHHVQAKLGTSQNGTFILRFSDSMTGAISVAFVENGIVKHIAPNDRKELDARDLPDRLRALEDLKYFYPNIPKEVVQKFHKKPTNKPLCGDYIFPVSVETLPDLLSVTVKSPPYVSSLLLKILLRIIKKVF